MQTKTMLYISLKAGFCLYLGEQIKVFWSQQVSRVSWEMGSLGFSIWSPFTCVAQFSSLPLPPLLPSGA